MHCFSTSFRGPCRGPPETSSTFSTFEWETFSNLQSGAFFIAGLYVVLSLALGLIGVWCGVLIARVFS